MKTIKALREAAEGIIKWGGRYGTWSPLEAHLSSAADEIERLTAELDRRERLIVNMDLEHRATIEALSAEVRAAKARERRAYVAGYNAVNTDMDSDLEKSWQQYRRRDGADWKSVSGRKCPGCGDPLTACTQSTLECIPVDGSPETKGGNDSGKE